VFPSVCSTHPTSVRSSLSFPWCWAFVCFSFCEWAEKGWERRAETPRPKRGAGKKKKGWRSRAEEERRRGNVCADAVCAMRTAPGVSRARCARPAVLRFAQRRLRLYSPLSLPHPIPPPAAAAAAAPARTLRRGTVRTAESDEPRVIPRWWGWCALGARDWHCRLPHRGNPACLPCLSGPPILTCMFCGC
jgi:hypothetical protein